MFRCSRKFSVGKTQKVVFHLISNRISRKILVQRPNSRQARLKERLSRSKLKQAFLIDSDAELFIRLMKSSASEPGLRIHLVMARTNIWISH